MRRVLAITPFLLGLSACEKPADPAPPAPEAPAAPAPPVIPAAFAGDFKGVGTEPFWGFEIRPGKLKFTRPEPPEITAADPVLIVENNVATWTTSALVITLTEGT